MNIQLTESLHDFRCRRRPLRLMSFYVGADFSSLSTWKLLARPWRMFNTFFLLAWTRIASAEFTMLVYLQIVCTKRLKSFWQMNDMNDIHLMVLPHGKINVDNVSIWWIQIKMTSNSPSDTWIHFDCFTQIECMHRRPSSHIISIVHT